MQVRSIITHSLRMTGLALLSMGLVSLGHMAPAGAQDVKIGLVAPLSGTFALLGEQFANGARVAVKDDGIALEEVDDSCTAEGGEQAASKLLEAEVTVVVGFLCTPSLEAALPLLTERGIPVLTPVRTPNITDTKNRTGWLVWRIAPRLDDEANAVARLLVRAWRDKHFAIIDDGTIYGRELAEHLRAEAELAGLKPVLFDTFRPGLDNQIGLVGRLRRSGATHVFVGGDRSDIAIIARDARKLGYDVVLAGGEALRAADDAVRLSKGVLMIAPPLWEELASPDLLDKFRQEGIIPEGYTLLGHAAVDIAAGAARAAAADGTSITDQLQGFSFDTAVGVIRFNDKGDLANSLYRLYAYDGMHFVEEKD